MMTIMDSSNIKNYNYGLLMSLMEIIFKRKAKSNLLWHERQFKKNVVQHNRILTSNRSKETTGFFFFQTFSCSACLDNHFQI